MKRYSVLLAAISLSLISHHANASSCYLATESYQQNMTRCMEHAAHNSACAQVSVAMLNLVTEDMDDKNYRAARRWLEQAAMQDYILAQTLFADLLFESLEETNNETDLKRALYWFEKAAQKGSVYAQEKVSEIYLDESNGVSNEEKGDYWSEMAEGFQAELDKKELSDTDEEAWQLVGVAYERPAVRACIESVDEIIMRDF